MLSRQKNKNMLTAEEYRLRAEMHRTSCKNQMKIFFYTGLFCVAAFVIASVAALAWFANNKEVEADGMYTTLDFGDFELKSEGIDANYEVYYDASSFFLPFSSLLSDLSGGKLSANHLLTEISEGLFSAQTEGSHMRVNWLLGPDSGFEEIVPGASGVLTFYVRSKGAKEISLMMEIQAYSITEKETEIPITTGGAFGGRKLYLTESSETAFDLLKGHILFFEPSYDSNNEVADKYHEMLPLDNGKVVLPTISITEEQAKQETWVPVQIYWIWPLNLGQMVLPDGAKNLDAFAKKGLFADEIRDSLKDRMIEKKHCFFYNYGDNILDEELEKMRTLEYSPTAYTEYSNYYNYADQYIGMNIDYLMVSVTAY